MREQMCCKSFPAFQIACVCHPDKRKNRCSKIIGSAFRIRALGTQKSFHAVYFLRNTNCLLNNHWEGELDNSVLGCSVEFKRCKKENNFSEWWVCQKFRKMSILYMSIIFYPSVSNKHLQIYYSLCSLWKDFRHTAYNWRGFWKIGKTKVELFVRSGFC